MENSTHAKRKNIGQNNVLKYNQHYKQWWYFFISAQAGSYFYNKLKSKICNSFTNWNKSYT
ncbi:hypothetical protein LPE509_02289 [Legionella pneumophila subsp. pneumophila LPE509]|nr:hypothetical protein LPE509_02289 [Legionella pneumophila subsp. pneumophila LPE509]